MATAAPKPVLEKVWVSPRANPETRPFWDAAAEGKFMIGRCKACGEAHFYPRSICPYCWSDDTRLKQSSGEGVVYTFSIMRKSPTGPFAIGYVTLAEGPSVLTNFVDCDLDALRIGDRVRVVFRQTDGAYPVPLFTPLRNGD